MKSVKISIVTPSYNQADFIEDAIQSVLQQNYPDFEHIIVDNCSTDGTIEILKRYPHLKYISEPDEGQSDALNKGFRIATGDVIGWLNADDYYYPGTFAKVSKQFANPKVDAIYSNVRFVDAQGKHMRNLRSHPPLKWLSLFYTFIQSTSFFFRKTVIEKQHFLDKDLNLCMDKDFYVRLLYNNYNFKYVNDYFAGFRWHGNNKSSVSKEVKEKSNKEYFYIINKNTRFNLKYNSLNVFVYWTIFLLIIRPTRGILKVIGIFK